MTPSPWPKAAFASRRMMMTRLEAVIILVAALISAALVGFEVHTAGDARAAALRQTQIKVANLANAVAAQLERSIESADIVLESIAERAETNPFDAYHLERLKIFLQQRAAQIKTVAGMSLIDSDGTVIASSLGAASSSSPNVADRPYFAFHRANPGAGLHIDGPFVGRFGGRPLFTATRAIRSPDGKFQGVAYASIATEFFQKFYATLDTGKQGLILIALDDGTLVARHPEIEGYGRRDSGQPQPLFSTYLPLAPAGSFRDVSAIGRQARWNAYRSLPDLHLVVLAALSEAEELAEWQLQTLNQAILLAAILAIVLGSSVYILVQIRRRGHAEQSLRDSEARWRTIFDTAIEGIVTIDEFGTIETLNPATARIFGYAAPELLGRNVRMLIPESYRTPYECCLDDYQRSGEAKINGISLELIGRRKDGSSFPIQLAISDMTVSGRRMFTAILRDVTERRKAEIAVTFARQEAEHANKAKSRFLANMSHEIRTPLSGIIGLLGLLRHDHLGPTQRHKVEMACRSADILMGVIGNVLDMSKLEAGAVELESAPFELAAIVEDAVQTLSPAAATKEIELRTEIAPAARRWYVGDAAKLRQILTNLLGNAVKFTAAGHVVLRIDSARRGEAADLSFSVIDTGIGIAADQIPHLFEPFAQANQTIARRFGGTGLGLAISRQFVELMGSRIAIDSMLGQGSVFRFSLRLPLVLATPLPTTDASTGDGFAAPERLLREKHVLMVEDDPVNRLAGVGLLERCGAFVAAAENGADGMAKAMTDRYDFILMDMRLPGLDGLEATRRIRTSAGPNRDTPILALTANAFAEDIVRCRDAGMNGHLVKPLDLQSLASRLAEIFTTGETETIAPSAAEPTGGSTGPETALDPSALAKLEDDLSPSAVQRIVDLFLAHRPEQLDRLRSAWRKQDFDRLSIEAHNFKGAARLLGARPLEEATNQLENRAADLSQSDLVALIDRIGVESETVARLLAARYKPEPEGSPSHDGQSDPGTEPKRAKRA